MKILAVEDDPIASAVLTASLSALGYDVTSASDGVTAWVCLQREPIRVVVCDWLMPNVDGLELCRQVRARPGDYVYFILVTNRTPTVENQDVAFAAGVDDFLSKPVAPQDLKTRLHVAERILGFTSKIQTLETFIPICSYCKKVRDDRSYWQQIESYINERTGSEFSHSVCPDCYERHVAPELKALGLGHIKHPEIKKKERS
jgi:sigma-B regulation protein RsbU (phosphoserine phosphatase)